MQEVRDSNLGLYTWPLFKVILVNFTRALPTEDYGMSFPMNGTLSARNVFNFAYNEEF